jgi:polar amino acid transport system substrate-binding protein
MTKFPTACLELELTETVMVESVDHAKEVLQQIKARGIQIALDDFGTGYSSLKYLKDLPIDLLKIDKTFVDSIKDKKDESFIAAIISLSQIMNFAVISEGVEEEYQRQVLADLGCDYIQGFLWGRPLMLEDARKLIFGIPVRPEEPKEISPPKRR